MHKDLLSVLCKPFCEDQETMEYWCNSSFSMILLLLPTIMLLCIITALIVMRMVSQKGTCKLPPGPRGLPIIGHLHLLGKLPHQALFELSKLHGPLMSLQFGRFPVLVASSPDMAREILQTHDRSFSNRMSMAVPNHIFGVGMDIGFSSPNAHWKLMRKLCATELFSTKGLHFSQPVRLEEIRTLMRSVLAESVDATPHQMRPKLLGATNDIIMRMLVGRRFSELAGGRQAVQGRQCKASVLEELVGELFELLGMFNVGDWLPHIAWMDLQGCARRSKRLAAQLRAAFEGIIQDRRLANQVPPNHNNFLDVLLQASASSNTPIHIMEVLLDLFAAATETSGVTIEWALADLLLNPEKMRRVQAEIDEVVGIARVIQEEDIDNLPFLKACVKETMRLHPTAPLLVPHKTNQACDILDFHILANTLAFVNVWAIGRDPKVWKNPTKFSPERFLEASCVDLQGQHFELIPFGSGRRMCVGWRLGLLSVLTILASLLQGFEWSIPPSHHLDMSESFHMSLSLATPLVTYTTPRLPKELY